MFGLGTLIDTISSGIKVVRHFVSVGVSKAGKLFKKVGHAAGKIIDFYNKISKYLPKPTSPYPHPPFPGPIVVDGPRPYMDPLEVIADTAAKLAHKTKTTSKEENPDELGYRLYEANENPEWNQRETYHSSDEYTDYLKEKVPEIDKTGEWQDHVLGYRSIGSAYLYLETARKLGIEIPEEFMVDIGRCCMAVDDVMTIIKAFQKVGLKKIDFSEYLLGTLDSNQSEKIENAVISTLQEDHPGLSAEEAADKISQMRACARSDEEVANLYKGEIDKRVNAAENSTDRQE